MGKKIDMRGEKWGRWTVIREDGIKCGNVTWFCECECGETRTVIGASLRKHRSKSCGCLHDEIAQKTCSKTGLLGRKRPPEMSEVEWNKNRCAKDRKTLSNIYIKQSISSKSQLRHKDIPQELIDFKRYQISKHRELKTLEGRLKNEFTMVGSRRT